MREEDHDEIISPLTDDEIYLIERELRAEDKSKKRFKALKRLLEDRIIFQKLVNMLQSQVRDQELLILSLESRIVCDQGESLEDLYGDEDGNEDEDDEGD